MKNPSPLPRLASNELVVRPLERAETIPSRWYTDPLMFDFDRRSVFAKTWQYAGHLSRM